MVAAKTACSARRLRANRANAKKSTGPKTEQGKARSSRNATGYGIFCQSLLLPGEDRQMLEMLRTSLIHEHQPQNITELFLVDRTASAMWRLRRVQAAEAQAHAAMEQQMIENARQVKRELEEEMENEDYDDEDDTEEQDQEEDEELHPPRPLPAAVTTCGLISDGSGKLSTLEKLSLYEKRLEGTVHRCLRDLRKLRTPIKGEIKPDRPSPFLETKLDEAEPRSLAQVSADQEVAREDENMKNEPTDLAAERTGPVAYRPGDDAKQSWKEQSESRPVRQGVQDEPLPPNIVMFHAHGEF